MDLYSRYIVRWQLSNSLEKEIQTELLQTTIHMNGKLKINNSDQGAQYTCEHWVSTLSNLQIKISMDGKIGRPMLTSDRQGIHWTMVQNHKTEVYLSKPGTKWA